jgi:hypothetical protein
VSVPQIVVIDIVMAATGTIKIVATATATAETTAMLKSRETMIAPAVHTQ